MPAVRPERSQDFGFCLNGLVSVALTSLGRAQDVDGVVSMKAILRWALAGMVTGAALASPASAQFGQQAPWVPEHARFVRLASGVPGVLFEPAEKGPKSSIAFFVMHASGDYTNFSACTELSKRGYLVLCANNSTSKSGIFDDGALDKVLLEAKAGVGYLRGLAGVKTVLLFGHSGGNTVMTAYQMVAEGGVAACQGAEKIHRCPDNLQGLPKADGIVMADSNWGQSTMSLLSIDPAVRWPRLINRWMWCKWPRPMASRSPFWWIMPPMPK
jgi:hypothetical protein